MAAITAMTIEEKIGQMLFLGWDGDDSLLNINEQARRCVAELHAGGMILFARNVQERGNPLPPVDINGVRAMLEELQSLAKVPLYVAADQEGGRVARFGPPFTTFPAARVLGEVNDTELARRAAWVSGTELRAVGVNTNFAPVADVNSNPANPVIGERSFGATPELAATMVTAQVHGYAEAGVLSCAKHFPGHGDTSVDSHLALPTVPHDRATMESRELVPFQAAITAGIPAIMTAHILFPALDATGVPATLSRPILTDLLRKQLGFEGLIVTDCLQMKAVADHWGTARAAVMAANAGADILLICHSWDRQKEAFEALVAAVHSGELPEARVDEAVTRILAGKRSLFARTDRPTLSVVGSSEHQEVARPIYERAGIPFKEPTMMAVLGEAVPA